MDKDAIPMDEGRFADLAALVADDGEGIAPYRSARGPRPSPPG